MKRAFQEYEGLRKTDISVGNILLSPTRHLMPQALSLLNVYFYFFKYMYMCVGRVGMCAWVEVSMEVRRRCPLPDLPGTPDYHGRNLLFLLLLELLWFDCFGLYLRVCPLAFFSWFLCLKCAKTFQGYESCVVLVTEWIWVGSTSYWVAMGGYY